MKLYQDRITQYYKNRPYAGKPAAYTHCALLQNPMCGDVVTVYVTLREGMVQEMRVDVQGCVLSVAAASMLAEQVQQVSIIQVAELTEEFMQQLISLPLGPNRLRCATLALHTLHKIVREYHD